MLKTIFLSAIRNFSRHKGFSAIYLSGLSIGLACCLLIGIFIRDEFQFDQAVPDADRIYRVYTKNTNHDGTRDLAVVPPVYAATLKQNYPEVEEVARVLIIPQHKTLFTFENKSLYEESGYFVDSTYLSVLPLNCIFGNAPDALKAPNDIVLSEEMASRFFGNTNPVNKTLLMEKQPYRVTAVFRKDPKFHLSFDYLVPLAAAQLPADRMQSWTWHQFATYVKVKTGTDIHRLESLFSEDAKKKYAQLNHDPVSSDIPGFQSLSKIHLYSSDFKFDTAQRGNIQYVKALGFVALFILVIACFNFINLATARSLQRAREVGVRKAIGAEKRLLIFQFMGESVLLALLSMLIAVSLCLLLLPWLNSFTDKQLSWTIFLDPLTGSAILGTAVLVGVAAGFYPALVLSGFKPVKVLKSGTQAEEQPGKILLLRHFLVVTQFALSVLMIICAVIVYKQVRFLHEKDLGFNKDQIMFFPMRGDRMFKNSTAFKEELLKYPGITSVSIGYGFPGDAVAGDDILVPENGVMKSKSATQLAVDMDYVKTLGLQIVAGRDFSQQMKTDPDHAFIINETAVRELGFHSPQEAIGQPLAWHPWDAKNADSLKRGNIIGVVKDFNYKSLYDKVETTVLQIYPDAAWKIAVKLNSANPANAIANVKKAWAAYAPDYPIEYKFLDENFEVMYTSEDKLKSLLWIFTSLAVFVGCLGLFGLAVFVAARKRREIGIRKVLGASVPGIIYLLSKDFLKLIFISVLIASPVAWFFMSRWLTDFAYRISISGWIFVLTAIAVSAIALVTISFQAVRAAMANPVHSLKTE